MSLLRRLYDVARSQLRNGSDRLWQAAEPGVSVGGGSREANYDFKGRAASPSADNPSASNPSAGNPSASNASAGNPSANKLEAQYYANLELSPGASYEEIRSAYRELLRKYHPDRHHQDPQKAALALEITKRLNEAMKYFQTKSEGEQS